MKASAPTNGAKSKQSGAHCTLHLGIRRHMELHHIRYFLALCEELNFNKAAKRCGISQPSLTNAIKRLEENVGGLLFLRQRGAQPTALALAIKPHLKQAMRAVRKAREKAELMLQRTSE